MHGSAWLAPAALAAATLGSAALADDAPAKPSISPADRAVVFARYLAWSKGVDFQCATLSSREQAVQEQMFREARDFSLKDHHPLAQELQPTWEHPLQNIKQLAATDCKALSPTVADVIAKIRERAAGESIAQDMQGCWSGTQDGVDILLCVPGNGYTGDALKLEFTQHASGVQCFLRKGSGRAMKNPRDASKAAYYVMAEPNVGVCSDLSKLGHAEGMCTLADKPGTAECMISVYNGVESEEGLEVYQFAGASTDLNTTFTLKKTDAAPAK